MKRDPWSALLDRIATGGVELRAADADSLSADGCDASATAVRFHLGEPADLPPAERLLRSVRLTGLAQALQSSGGVGEEAIRRLLVEARGVFAERCKEIQDSTSYPATPITGRDWTDGATIARCAEACARIAAAIGPLRLETNMQEIRIAATLAVCSHYHHLVGPAMIAVSDTYEREGWTDRAAGNYEAVIADFSWILDDLIEDEDAPDGDEATALGALRRAHERSQALGAGDAAEHAARIAAIDAVLVREEDDDGDDE